MGVHQLWRLLDGYSSPMTAAQWSGRVIAVDASVWMAQFRGAQQRRRGFAGGASNGFDDGVEDGSTQRLLGGFLSRILKLIYYDITPIFVFDGPSSASKVHEVRRRSGIRLRRERETVVRRAKRILEAQVAAGIITKSTLAQLPMATMRAQRPMCASGSPGRMSPKKAARFESDTPTKRFVRRRCARGRAVVLAPDEVSRAYLSTFVKESAQLVDERNEGAAIAAANTLQASSSFCFTRSSSLFLGARSALEAGLASSSSSSLKPSSKENCDGNPLPSRRHDKSRSEWTKNTLKPDDNDSSDDCHVVLKAKPRWVPHHHHGAGCEPIEVDNVRDDDDDDIALVRTHSGPLFRQPSPLSTVSTSTRSSASREETMVTDSLGRSWNETTEGDADGPEEFVPVFVRTSSSIEGEKTTFAVVAPQAEVVDGDETSNSVTFVDAPPECANRVAERIEDRSHERRKADNRNDQSRTRPLRPTTGSGTVRGRRASALPCTEPMGFTAMSTKERIRPKHVEVDVIPFELVDLVELLRLCDVRFVISPSEADAQCAYLSKMGVVDGVFTEDSDVVVHGASVVLRGFFTQPHVMATSQAALRAAGITKGVLLALSQLLGCDYTAGAALGVRDALDAIACSRGPLTYGPFVPPQDDDEALQWAQETLRTWIQLLATPDHALWPLDLSIAQRTASMHRMASKWLNLVRTLQTGGDDDPDCWNAGEREGSNVKQALLSLPNNACLKLFTEDVPLNRGVDRRPTSPNPDWIAIKRFAHSRGLADLVMKVDLTAKEVARRQAATKAANECRNGDRSRLDPRQRTLDNVVVWRAPLEPGPQLRQETNHSAAASAEARMPESSPNMDARQRAICAAVSWLRNSRGQF